MLGIVGIVSSQVYAVAGTIHTNWPYHSVPFKMLELNIAGTCIPFHFAT